MNRIPLGKTSKKPSRLTKSNSNADGRRAFANRNLPARATPASQNIIGLPNELARTLQFQMELRAGDGGN